MLLYVGGMPSQTIAAWTLDPVSLAATKVDEAAGLFSPSFLCPHPSRPLLYAAERKWSEQDASTGAVTTFAIGPANGALQAVHRCRSGGAFTAHLEVSADGRFLTTANPRGPTIALFALDDHGLPEAAPDIVSHSGRGATAQHTEPWPHSAFFDREIARVLACDMGLDRVFIHDLDAHANRLVPAPQAFAQVSSGAGARHLAISANGQFVYVVNELDSTLSVFRYEAQSGRLTIVQTASTLPTGCSTANQPAEIVISPDGHNLYVTNRGVDSLAQFEIDRADGRVTLIGQVATLGESPRHVCISPDGAIIAVCNQKSNAVRLFRRERDGSLQSASSPIPFDSPTCARIIDISHFATIDNSVSIGSQTGPPIGAE